MTHTLQSYLFHNPSNQNVEASHYVVFFFTLLHHDCLSAVLKLVQLHMLFSAILLVLL